MFGRELRLPVEMVMGRPPASSIPESEYLENLVNTLEDIHAHNRNTLNSVSRRMKTYYDLRSAKRSFEVGQLVWLYFPHRVVGRCPKLQCDWEGPYKITEAVTEVVYKIKKCQGGKMRTVHVDRLAPYRERRE